MSSESEMLKLAAIGCCDIYEEFSSDNVGISLWIGVNEGNCKNEFFENDYIKVEHDSGFANLIRYLLKDKTEEELLKASRGEI